MTLKLVILGYQCDRCTRKQHKYVIDKDYKNHLRKVHKIPESHIPEELIGSPWDEEFVILYKSDKKCSRCKRELIMCRYRYGVNGDADFLEYRCPVEDEKGHHHYNGRVYVGKKKLKFFCEHHGYNSDKEPCFMCNVTVSINKALFG